MSQRNDSFLSPNIPQDAWPKIGNLVVSSRPIFERGRAAEINTLCAYLPVPSTCLNYARFLCPWISPGKNTGVGSLFLLQGIFLTQDRTKVSPLAGGFFTIWATREPSRSPCKSLLTPTNKGWQNREEDNSCSQPEGKQRQQGALTSPWLRSGRCGSLSQVTWFPPVWSSPNYHWHLDQQNQTLPSYACSFSY